VDTGGGGDTGCVAKEDRFIEKRKCCRFGDTDLCRGTPEEDDVGVFDRGAGEVEDAVEFAGVVVEVAEGDRRLREQSLLPANPANRVCWTPAGTAS